MKNSIRHFYLITGLLAVALGLCAPASALQGDTQHYADPPPGLRLTGTIINTDNRAALIKVGSAREKEFAQGANVRPGVRLEEVRENYVLLMVGGQMARLDLEKAASPGGGHNPNLPTGIVEVAPPVGSTVPPVEARIAAPAPVPTPPPVAPTGAQDRDEREQRLLRQQEELEDQKLQRLDELERLDQQEAMLEQQEMLDQRRQEEQERQEDLEDQQHPGTAPLSNPADATSVP